MKSRHLLDLFNVVKDYRFFIQMMKDKRYTIPLVRKLIYILLSIYIIVPFDFIPGIIPIVGMVDDLGAFAVIIGVLLYEIAAYRDFLEEIKRRSGTVHTNGGRGITDVQTPEVTKKGEKKTE